MNNWLKSILVATLGLTILTVVLALLIVLAVPYSCIVLVLVEVILIAYFTYQIKKDFFS